MTAISSHPALDHIFAAGSYDEYVRLYDGRKMDAPMSKVCAGGGVWRAKWHPSRRGRMLVAAMHGGCRVLDFAALAADSERVVDNVDVLSKFTEHKSMAYGADWVYDEVAASCSFYDRQAFLWDPCSNR